KKARRCWSKTARSANEFTCSSRFDTGPPFINAIQRDKMMPARELEAPIKSCRSKVETHRAVDGLGNHAFDDERSETLVFRGVNGRSSRLYPLEQYMERNAGRGRQ